MWRNRNKKWNVHFRSMPMKNLFCLFINHELQDSSKWNSRTFQYSVWYPMYEEASMVKVQFKISYVRGVLIQHMHNGTIFKCQPSFKPIFRKFLIGKNFTLRARFQVIQRNLSCRFWAWCSLVVSSKFKSLLLPIYVYL